MFKLVLFSSFLWSTILWADSTDRVFNSLKPLIFRVKIAESLKAPKTSYGTGFVVDRRGIIATNFHVVSDFADTDRENNNIYVELENGEFIEAELLAFSIQNDLALLRVEQSFSGEILFSKKALSKGEKLYSIGLPEDLQMSIVEGVYNGVEKSGPYEVFFLSSPINGGMSGGPTVNSAGELVGINVARLVFSEDISFAVPKLKLEKLLEANKENLFEKKLNTVSAEKSSYQQLGGLSLELFQDLKNAEQMDVEINHWGQMSVPKDLKCWSSTGNSKELNYESSTYSCRLNSSSYLSSLIESGSYILEYKTIRPKGAWRWALFMLLGEVDLSTKFARVLEAFSSNESMKKYYTSYNCQNGFFEERGEARFKRWGLCVRSYKKNSEVLDVVYQMKKSVNENLYLFKVQYEGLNTRDLDAFVDYWSSKSLKM